MKLDNILGIITFSFSVIASLLIALNINYELYGYFLFTISSLTGAYLLYKSDVNRTMLWTNIYFFCVNILGIITHWS